MEEVQTAMDICLSTDAAAYAAMASVIPWIVTIATIAQKFIGKPEEKTSTIGKGFATFLDKVANLKLKK